MSRIRKNDTVVVIAGRDKGKTGRVLSVLLGDSKILVEGVNFVKRHTRRTSQDTKGGIAQKESLLNISKVMFFCKNCNKGARVGMTSLADGSKARFCKKCKEVIT